MPQAAGTWDLTWLSDQAGWLEGTAFPTWSGNSAITGHVSLANGLPGPFENLQKLKWDDQVIIHAYGQKFIYQVRWLQFVRPDDMSVLAHKDQAWVTLLTCKDYDQVSGAYRLRTAVQAVLVSSGAE